MQGWDYHNPPGQGQWTPPPPRARDSDKFDDKEIEFLKVLRRHYCVDSEEFQSWLRRMKQGGRKPPNEIEVMRDLKNMEDKLPGCDEEAEKERIVPRRSFVPYVPPVPQPDPGPNVMPQAFPPQPAQPAPPALPALPANQPPPAYRQPGQSGAPAPGQARLRAVLLAGQAQRRKEAATAAWIGAHNELVNKPCPRR